MCVPYLHKATNFFKNSVCKITTFVAIIGIAFWAFGKRQKAPWGVLLSKPSTSARVDKRIQTFTVDALIKTTSPVKASPRKILRNCQITSRIDANLKYQTISGMDEILRHTKPTMPIIVIHKSWKHHINHQFACCTVHSYTVEIGSKGADQPRPWSSAKIINVLNRPSSHCCNFSYW